MENASRQLQTKFDIARTLFERAPAAGVPGITTQALANELAALEMKFALSTAHLYIAARGSETGRIAAASEFARVLAAGGFAADVDRLVTRAETALRDAGVPVAANAGGQVAAGAAPAAKPAKAPKSKKGAAGGNGILAGALGKKAPPAALCHELQKLLDTYPRGAASGTGAAFGAPVTVDYDRCANCAGAMATDAGRSELHCGECGAVRELVGTVFEDSQFYSQEGQKAKSGTFNPNRHFQYWWTHIFAKEPEEELGDKDDPDNNYGERVLDQLRALVVRDRRVLRLLTVDHVRSMLREVGRTDLNKNVPLILKKLTGIGPPAIPEEIQIRTENLFTKAIEAAEQVQRSARVNRNYYPSYVHRILAHLLPRDNYELCRTFYYIHVQSKDTVEADDENWEAICRALPGELEYEPLDRTLGAKYPPT